MLLQRYPKYTCFITGGEYPLLVNIRFVITGLDIPERVDLADLYSAAAVGSDNMRTEAQRTGNSIIPAPLPGHSFSELAFEHRDVGIYLAAVPCIGQGPDYGTGPFPRRIAPATYSMVALVLDGLMSLMHNKAPATGRNVAVCDISIYEGDVAPIDPARENFVGGVIWQSKTARHYLPNGIDYVRGYVCDEISPVNASDVL